MANAFLQQTDVLGQGEHHLQVRVFFVGQLPELLHRPLLVDLVSFLHSDSLLFFLAEKTTAIIMTAVESRYFLRINGHPLGNPRPPYTLNRGPHGKRRRTDIVWGTPRGQSLEDPKKTPR